MSEVGFEPRSSEFTGRTLRKGVWGTRGSEGERDGLQWSRTLDGVSFQGLRRDRESRW